MLERLVAGAVRYGHELAVVQLAVTADGEDPTLAARLGASLRGADALVRWEPGVYIALLPDTGGEGAAVAAERLRQAAATEVVVGFAHWQGDTAPDLLERSGRALAREREALAS